MCEKFVLEEIDLEKNEVGVKRWAGLVDAHIQDKQSFGQRVCRMATAYPLVVCWLATVKEIRVKGRDRKLRDSSV